MTEKYLEKRQHIIGTIFFSFLPVPCATPLANQLLREKNKSWVSRWSSAIQTYLPRQTNCLDMHYFEEIGALETKEMGQAGTELNRYTSCVLK